MKGHPGCGKSTLARSLGRALRWPVLDKDDIRDCTRPLEAALSQHPSSSSLLNAFSYQTLWRLTETQLQLGLSVIVDCPLSRPSLFVSASALATLYSKRLIIIECVASDAHQWKRRLETRAVAGAAMPENFNGRELHINKANPNVGPSVHPLPAHESASGREISEIRRQVAAHGNATDCPAGWHKPGHWEDLQALIEGYEGCWDYDTSPFARRLVVDGTAFSLDALLSAVLEWLEGVTDETPSVSYIP